VAQAANEISLYRNCGVDSNGLVNFIGKNLCSLPLFWTYENHSVKRISPTLAFFLNQPLRFQTGVRVAASSWTFVFCSAAIVLIFGGCNRRTENTTLPTSTTSHQPANRHENAGTREPSNYSDDLDGNTILRSVANRYAVAHSYRDQGELLLTYTLEGRAIKEPHPFSTVWHKDQLLSMRLFKSQVQGDGKLLSCYVYDIASANLDGQQLVLPVEQRLPISQLFEDSLVRHYLGGYADLPLDESDKTQVPKLIPPPVALLTGQLPFGWILAPQLSQRLPDQMILDRKYYVIRSKFNEMTADIWIDQATKLLKQISMPLKVMDHKVMTSREIADVELMMHFHEATIDVPELEIERTAFKVELKPKATPVRRFLSVPEPFPSERIGQLVPKFELLKPNGERVDHLYFDGKTTVLLWTGAADEAAVFEQLQQLRKTLSSPEIAWGVVYSEIDLEPNDSNSLRPNRTLAQLAQHFQIPLYFDRQLQTSNKFQLQLTAAVTVLNPSSKLEFVGSVNKEKWFEEIATVIQKVQQGSDVASEMKSAYQEFQAEYQKQRLASSARNLLPAPQANDISPVSKPSTDQLSASFQWNPTLAWLNRQFAKAGNVLVNPHRSPSTLIVMDGYRTVVELDSAGTELARFQLELPDQGAVSCLRTVPPHNFPSQQIAFAGFNVQGEKIYLFDANWKLLATLPPAEFPHDGIRDMQFQPREAKSPLVVVAFANAGGCLEIDTESQVLKQVSRSRVDSVARLRDKIFFCSATQWGRVGDETETPAISDDLMYHRLISVEAAEPALPGFMGVTTVDRENNWCFGQVSELGKLAWRQPVGSQLLENEMEPLAVCEFVSGSRSMLVVAIADAAHRVTMVSGDGSYLGQFASPAPLSGLAMIEDRGALHLILSTDKGVANYRLIAGGVSATPISDPRAP
jgi:hypothetical protein